MLLCLIQQHAEGRDVWSWVENPVSGGAAFTAFLVVIFRNMGFWATLLLIFPPYLAL